jgi:hypothetical protein
VDAALRSIIGGLAGDVLSAALGPRAALHELTAITSEPGATEQPLHADACWSAGAPRLVTAVPGAARCPRQINGPHALLPIHALAELLPGRGLVPPPGCVLAAQPARGAKTRGESTGLVRFEKGRCGLDGLDVMARGGGEQLRPKQIDPELLFRRAERRRWRWGQAAARRLSRHHINSAR